MTVAYFYFVYNAQEKQGCEMMLRSLIAQLSAGGGQAHKQLDALYSTCDTGGSQPSLTMLLDTLQEILKGFCNVFILVDALDESEERQKLVTSIKQIAGWGIAGLHMLVTSRALKVIEEPLSTLLDDEQKISVGGAFVKDDIRTYVQSRIRTDHKLRKWKKQAMGIEIEETLVEKAGGM